MDCEAEVVYASPDKRVFVLVNNEESYELEERKKFQVDFTAETYKKLKGLEAIVHFFDQRTEYK